MKPYQLLFVLFLLGLVTHSDGKQVNSVVVSVASYFANFTGGTSTSSCRPSSELVLGGPVQVNCTYRGYAIPPRSQCRWGTPTGSQQSGLGFDGISTTTVPLDTDFFLGNFSHFNWKISLNTNARDVILYVLLSVNVNGAPLQGSPYLFPFKMFVNETPNTGAAADCPFPTVANNPCSDKISFGYGVTNTSFTLGQVQYTLQMTGFKESQSSGSQAIQYFISQEQQISTGYLFGRISLACPNQCKGGGTYIVNSANQCVCNCSTATPCTNNHVFGPDCNCVCNTTCANGGSVDQSDCSCNCDAVSCSGGRIPGSDCTCNCPPSSQYCNNSGTVYVDQNNNCACSCQPAAAICPARYSTDANCNCYCGQTCSSPRVLDASACQCVCDPSKTCPTNFVKDLNSCNCTCLKTCANSNLNLNNCTCGPCLGNWTTDPTNGNQCTKCKLVPADCQQGKLDNSTCSCSCNITCDLYNNGQVRDSVGCSCRACRAGECYCGNGKVEPGEQCDLGSGSSPCCQSCQYTSAPCNDGNVCNVAACNITNGQCVGHYKCAQSTECVDTICDGSGQCISTNKPDFTPCGAQPYNVCLTSCQSGQCSNFQVKCAADNDTNDCLQPFCNGQTGSCDYLPIDGTVCSDNNGCTESDTCNQGTCNGVPVTCAPSTDQCSTMICSSNLCSPVPLSNIPCNADNSSCTVNDMCQLGRCVAGDPVKCDVGNNQCQTKVCVPTTGLCVTVNLNLTCDDKNQCTSNDTCSNGACAGVDNGLCKGAVKGSSSNYYIESSAALSTLKRNTALIFAIVGAALLIAAIAGIAFLIKKVRDGKLLDPDTWDPDKFSSVGSNPLYKGSEKSVDNRMYEGST